VTYVNGVGRGVDADIVGREGNVESQLSRSLKERRAFSIPGAKTILIYAFILRGFLRMASYDGYPV
jgi:hypothetical protein